MISADAETNYELKWKHLKTVSRHFMSNNHTFSDISVIKISSASQHTNVRIHTEEVWITTLQTRKPGGLNLIQ